LTVVAVREIPSIDREGGRAGMPGDEMLRALNEGVLVGILVGAGHFGGDGKKPEITLRMHVRHGALFRWLERHFPGGRVYGPYSHAGRNYYQWCARGTYLREVLVPLFDRHLDPSLDAHAFERYTAMKQRYRLGPGPADDRGLDGESRLTPMT
jgi:hypothetical protein